MDPPEDAAAGRFPPNGEGVAGDAETLDQLASQLYPELRRLARGAIRRDRSGHTLQTTALVHEAYLRLAGDELAVESRAHCLIRGGLEALAFRRSLQEACGTVYE